MFFVVSAGICMLCFFFQPAVPDGSQSEVEAKPVPPPRSRQSQSQCNDNVYSADTTSNTTNAVVSGDIVSIKWTHDSMYSFSSMYLFFMSFWRQNSQLGEYPADYKTPRPVRPPPRPPLSKCMTTIKLKAAVDEDYHCISSNSEPTVSFFCWYFYIRYVNTSFILLLKRLPNVCFNTSKK